MKGILVIAEELQQTLDKVKSKPNPDINNVFASFAKCFINNNTQNNETKK